MPEQKLGTSDTVSAIVTMRPSVSSTVDVGGKFLDVTCRDKFGNVKWRDTAKNLVTDLALIDMGNVYFSGSAQTTTWYAGLLDDSPTLTAGSTLANASGFTEFDEYTGNRKEWVEVISGTSWVNNGTSADFVITGAGGGVGGAFICAGATGTSVLLFCGAALTGGNRVVATADTVAVTYTVALADA